ncbi:PREDICTED: DNA topoisomerase 6 subunit A-like [Fragaria vesca subsp. vesca]|uniref:DNA topoisomerase 6 subunit A-like n=1 Tax=Fragaria vesca subsp. vesca TaxID=101020 RepID=UPI0002C35719|nr:PREDICTED: DNA topoisomerase 6 subunit A-like [Fragaria vesca subsp. vesca]
MASQSRWTKPLPEKEVLRDLIDKHCKQCKDKHSKQRTRRKANSATSSTSGADYHEAKNLSIMEIKEELEALKQRLDDPDFSFITRGDRNVTYRACSDGVRRLTLKDINTRSKPRDDKRNNIRNVIKTILDSINEEMRESHQGTYYQGRNANENFTKRQEYEIIDDICCTIGCTTASFPVDAAEKAYVGGLLSWMQNEFPTYAQSRDDGVPVPAMRSEIDLRDHGAKFILVVEKKTCFVELLQKKFYDDYPCIIVTGMGMPGVGGRGFVKILWDTFRLPVYGLFDCDPSAIEMFNTYTVGSIEKAYDNVSLTCPSMTWLGVWPSDLRDLEIAGEDLSEKDIAEVDNLLKKEFVKDNPRSKEELKEMKRTGKKANLEALKEKFGPAWLSKGFLPYKLHRLLTEKCTTRRI